MVITCPNCQAKYKLPGKRLEGRGAKITCPRCSHVFVIFNKDRDASGRDAAVSVETDALQPASRRVTPPGPTRGSMPGTGPAPMGAQLPGGLRAEDIFSTDYAEEGEGEAGQRGSREPSSFEPPSFGVQRGRPRPEEVPSGPQDLFEGEVPSVTELDRIEGISGGFAAEGLDFKSIGITTWKVKVAIGLTYDFADIATLRRSIKNGKVTPADQISHDGKEWSRIGDDDELGAYLHRIYGEVKSADGIVEADVGAKASTEPEPEDAGAADSEQATAAPEAPKPDAGAGMQTSSTSLAELNRAALAEAKGADNIKVDLKRRRRRRRPKADAKTKPKMRANNPLLLGVAVCLAILLVVVLARGALKKDDAEAGTRSSISDAELEKIRERERERIRLELEKQTEQILDHEESEGGLADIAVEPPTPLPLHGGTAPDSDEVSREERERREAEARAERKRERERERDRERETSPTPADSGSGTADTTPDSDDDGGETVVVEESSAEDWAFLGQSALDGGNCSSAINNYREAVKMASGNATYNYKLGLSYHRCGKADSAVKYLKKASGSVPAAKELLEQIEGEGGAQ